MKPPFRRCKTIEVFVLKITFKGRKKRYLKVEKEDIVARKGRIKMPKFTQIREMLAFRKEDVPAVARRLGYKISDKGELMENGSIVKCYCGNKITQKNLGLVHPSSKIAFCDNPACYGKYLAEREDKI